MSYLPPRTCHTLPVQGALSWRDEREAASFSFPTCSGRGAGHAGNGSYVGRTCLDDVGVVLEGRLKDEVKDADWPVHPSEFLQVAVLTTRGT